MSKLLFEKLSVEMEQIDRDQTFGLIQKCSALIHMLAYTQVTTEQLSKSVSNLFYELSPVCKIKQIK